MLNARNKGILYYFNYRDEHFAVTQRKHPTISQNIHIPILKTINYLILYHVTENKVYAEYALYFILVLGQLRIKKTCDDMSP